MENLKNFPHRSWLCLVILLYLILCGHSAMAAGWTQKKGAGYANLGFNFVRTDKFYDPDGNINTVPTFSEYTTTFYGEYGLHEKLTFILNFPFFKRLTLNKLEGRQSGEEIAKGGSETYIADGNLGLRLALFKFKSTVTAIGLSIGVPIGKDNSKEGLLSTGDGEANQEINFQLGHSLYPLPGYTSFKIGFNNRINGYSDEFIYSLEFGYNLRKDLNLAVKSNGVESLKNGKSTVMGGMGGLFSNNQRFLVYGLDATYSPQDNMGYILGVFSAIRNQNTLSGIVYKSGVYLVF